MAYRKLTESQVIEMRDEYDRLRASGCRLATFYRLRAAELGVSTYTIIMACKRKTYKELADGRYKLPKSS